MIYVILLRRISITGGRMLHSTKISIVCWLFACYSYDVMPKLTIITPVYNGERFIESCLKTVVGQNCPDIEHLIVDGGSQDKTTEIVKQYAQKYPHLRWISEKDSGQSDAMNKGIALAHGNIISFLNADDFYEPNVLTRVLTIFKDLPEPSLLVGNCNVWDNRGIMYVNQPRKLRLEDLLMGTDIHPHPFNPSAYFYHKSLHQKIGLYDTNEHYVLDLDFIFRAVQAAKVKYVDETWGNYRFIEGTKTFEDHKRGESDKRAAALNNRHLESLPLFCQLRIRIKRYMIKSFRKRSQFFYFFIRIQFYFRNPREIAEFFKRTSRRISEKLKHT